MKARLIAAGATAAVALSAAAGAPLASGSTARAATAGEVTLTASQVRSAADIEAAIATATAGGTRRGTVTLDGSGGPFVYAGVDRSINIGVSLFTLRGIAGAAIANCDDGLFFDDAAANDVVVEDISFTCTGHAGFGVRGGATGTHERVMLLGNRFASVGPSQPGGGIALAGVRGWTIAGNTFSVPSERGSIGLALSDAHGTRIIGNTVESATGIRITGADSIAILGNTVRAVTDGIVLDGISASSWVVANRISGVTGSGIAFLGAPLIGPAVLANRISCAPGHACNAVLPATGVDEAGTIFAPGAMNLVPNGAVEADPAGTFFTAGKAAFAWSTAAWRSPGHSLSITSPAAPAPGVVPPRWLTRTRSIAVLPGQRFEASAWLRTAGGGRGQLVVTFWTAGETYIPGSATFSAPTPASGTGTGWLAAGVSATAPPTAAFARVEIRLLTAGTLWADDLALVRR